MEKKMQKCFNDFYTRKYYLGNADCKNPVSQFFSDKKTQNLERCLEPKRGRNYQHLLQSGRVTAWQQITEDKFY